MASYQTIRLGAGRHREGGDEACVLELASMLAGEPFSDRPATACPLIASILRGVNDALDDRRRQWLLPYASAVVGTRASDAVLRERLELCRVTVGDPVRGHSVWLRLFGSRDGRPRRRELSAAARRVLCRIGVEDDDRLCDTLELVDALIALTPRDDDGGSDREVLPEPAPTAGVL